MSNVSGGIRSGKHQLAEWRSCCFTELWDNFLTSGFQPLMGLCSADGKPIHSEFKPVKFFFLPSRNSSKPVCKLLEGPQTTGWKPQDTFRKKFLFSHNFTCWCEFLAPTILSLTKNWPVKWWCHSKNAVFVSRKVWQEPTKYFSYLITINKLYFNIFKDLKLIFLPLYSEKKLGNAFPLRSSKYNRKQF